MPNWTTIDLAALNERKVAELIDALRTEALGAGQLDPMPGIIADVTGQLRGAIEFSGKYEVDADPATVPNGLREITVKKIIREMKGRLDLGLTKTEDEDALVWESRLKALINFAWPVDKPDTALDVPETQAVAAVPLIREPHRHFSRRDQDGL